ncbi:MAG: FlgT C-terminal domain-containing protein [bacterium]|nr:FlgT C-terminal domain-containing protein [bacterium]
MNILIPVVLFLVVAFLPSIKEVTPGLKKAKAPEVVEETKSEAARPVVVELESAPAAIESDTEVLIPASELEDAIPLEEISLTETEEELFSESPPPALPVSQKLARELPQIELTDPQRLVVESEMRELKREAVSVSESEAEPAVTEKIDIELQPEEAQETRAVSEPETKAVTTEEIEIQPKRRIPEKADDTKATSLPKEAIEVELIPTPPVEEPPPSEKKPAAEEKGLIEVSSLPGPTLPEVTPERRLVLTLFNLPGDPGRLVFKQLEQRLRETNFFKVVAVNLPLLEESPTEPAGNIAHLDEISIQEAVDLWETNLAITGRVVSNTYFSSLVINLKLLRLPGGEELLRRTILTSRDKAAAEIEALTEEIKAQFPIQQGQVIQVEGDYVILDLGYFHGLREGMELLVYRVGGLLKEAAQGSPSSGEIIGARTEDVAIIRVDKVTDKSSQASVLELFPVQEIQVGDRVISR